jgi:L-ascorbate metabolism protein UlaG (beta-lactamase superfamily)
MKNNFNVNFHASVCIDNTVYIDPFRVNRALHNATVVFITHGHYDHYSIDDIKKVANSDTIFVATKDVAEKLRTEGFTNITEAVPNNRYRITPQIKAETFPAYNANKPYHTKEKNWVGFIIEKDGLRYAVLGDTDATDETKKIKCDVLFIPIGGTYTMNAKEAADCANIIKPGIAVPIHYLGIIGTKDDELVFKANLCKDILCKIFF